MEKKLILDHNLLEITTSRLCQELIENHQNFDNSVIIGLQPRGVHLAQKIHQKLEGLVAREIPLGYLDVTFYRDDFRRREEPIKANETKISFLIEEKKVILIDDVLFTGRTVRAALDALIAFGRPKIVELLVLVNRRYSRHFPIAPDYIGLEVNTIQSERVLVQWAGEEYDKNSVWISNQS